MRVAWSLVGNWRHKLPLIRVMECWHRAAIGAEMPSVQTVPATNSAPRAAPLRNFGRFRLLRLLGKSRRSMCWLVADPDSQRDLMLVLPRMQFQDAQAAPHWMQAVQRGARLQHPRLATAVEIGIHENWPFVAYGAEGRATLSDRIGRKGLPPAEAAAIMLDVLEGLAYAHEAGTAHHDVQGHLVLIDEQGRACVAGLEVAGVEPAAKAAPQRPASDAATRQAQRDAAELDVLAAGLVLHHALVGVPPLDEPDTGAVIARMPPAGAELVRLPFSTGAAIPEVLRTIANRAADRQERQRYRNARTLANALEAWLRADSQGEDGPLNALLDRMTSIGTLPAAADGAGRGARLASMERQRTTDLAALVVEDMALAFELLRQVNNAQSRSSQGSSGTVLTVRRAIAMLGMEGLRRAANALKPWPGTLNETHASELATLMERVKRAARIAVALRPAGFDAEVMALLTMLQNLGRMLLQYHCADDATQIRRLMAPAPAERAGEPQQPGMTEEAAAFSVIGTDIEAIGAAVAKRWGFEDDVAGVLRRWPLNSPPRAPENDGELLRLVASCANELVDLHQLQASQQAAALVRIAQRYGRVLHVQPKDLQVALQESANSRLSKVLLEGSSNAMYAADSAQADADASPFR